MFTVPGGEAAVSGARVAVDRMAPVSADRAFLYLQTVSSANTNDGRGSNKTVAITTLKQLQQLKRYSFFTLTVIIINIFIIVFLIFFGVVFTTNNQIMKQEIAR